MYVFHNTLHTEHCVKSVQIRSFFWSLYSRIRTEYGEILRISSYSIRMREYRDQKKLRIWTHFTQWKQLKGYISFEKSIEAFISSQ